MPRYWAHCVLAIALAWAAMEAAATSSCQWDAPIHVAFGSCIVSTSFRRQLAVAVSDNDVDMYYSTVLKNQDVCATLSRQICSSFYNSNYCAWDDNVGCYVYTYNMLPSSKCSDRPTAPANASLALRGECRLSSWYSNNKASYCPLNITSCETKPGCKYYSSSASCTIGYTYADQLMAEFNTAATEFGSAYAARFMQQHQQCSRITTEEACIRGNTTGSTQAIKSSPSPAAAANGTRSSPQNTTITSNSTSPRPHSPSPSPRLPSPSPRPNTTNTTSRPPPPTTRNTTNNTNLTPVNSTAPAPETSTNSSTRTDMLIPSPNLPAGAVSTVAQPPGGQQPASAPMIAGIVVGAVVALAAVAMMLVYLRRRRAAEAASTTSAVAQNLPDNDSPATAAMLGGRNDSSWAAPGAAQPAAAPSYSSTALWPVPPSPWPSERSSHADVRLQQQNPFGSRQ